MSEVKNYVENMFYSLPKTKEVVETKLGIIENMEEKYQELRDSGNTEKEAFGIVVSEFGSMDELCREMGWAFNAQNPVAEPDSPPSPNPKIKELYTAFLNKHPFTVPTIATLIPFGFIIMMLSADYSFSRLLLSGAIEILSIISFIAGCILLAMVLFIYLSKKVWQNIKAMPQESSGTTGKTGHKNPKIKSVCGIIMMLSLEAFVLISVVADIEITTAFIFPVGGILCGIVRLIANMLKD